jgi:large subunit ribosomal protein L25
VDGSDQLTIPKSIQRHPIRGEFEHVDLLAVRRGEKVTVDVPLVLTGHIAPGGLLGQDHTTVTLEAEATHLPTEIEVSIDGLEIGSHITAGDLKLPSGSTLVTDAETLLVSVSTAPTEADLEAEVAEAAEELGIVEDKPEETDEAAADTAAEETAADQAE